MAGRRGPKTPEWVELLIVDRFEQQEQEEGHTTADLVMDSVHRTIDARQQPGLQRFKPGLRKVQEVLQDYRTRRRQKQEDQRRDWELMESDWSIGAGAAAGIPDSANPILLKLWRYCNAAGIRFSVRQARWATRYAAAMNRQLITPQNAAFFLYYKAAEAGRLERICNVLGKPVSTADLDARSGMEFWELRTARRTNAVPQDETTSALLERAMMEVGTEERHSYSATATVFHHLGLRWQYPDWPFGFLRADSVLDLVVAYWLRYLSKGPSWSALSKDEQQNIGMDLIQQVRQLPRDQDVPNLWEPAELLKKVGYRHDQ